MSKLTIGMACIDNFEQVWFTIQSLTLAHPRLMEECQILVVDNNPASANGRQTARLVINLGKHRCNTKYVPMDNPKGTQPARNRVFKESDSPWTLCMDSHVILHGHDHEGTLKSLFDYIEEFPDSEDLLTGPCWGSIKCQGTQQNLSWRHTALGIWHITEEGMNLKGKPFEIPQQGLGCMVMRSDKWPGFHPEAENVGGCETYLCQNVRDHGGRVLCAPFLRWSHYFAPGGPKNYTPDLNWRFRNYLKSHIDQGFDPAGVIHEYKDKIPIEVAKEILDEVLMESKS
ncbi:hypothetical protein KAR91_20080 [Candidatus Pacearchaeota archaeon]|nr:hypothetical protein [Candidatus Pacearchaeota archaeon]